MRTKKIYKKSRVYIIGKKSTIVADYTYALPPAVARPAARNGRLASIFSLAKKHDFYEYLFLVISTRKVRNICT